VDLGSWIFGRFMNICWSI